MTVCAGTTREHARCVPVTPPGAGRPALRMTATDLPAKPASAAAARRRATAALNGWGLHAIADDCAVVVSELVTNACRAAAGPAGRARPVRLRVTALPGQSGARIEVWDPGPGTPAIAAPADDSPSGRGLLIVAALSREWGTRPAPCGGKLTWAVITP